MEGHGSFFSLSGLDAEMPVPGGAGLALIISSAELTGHGPGPGKAAELKQPPKCSGGAGLTWIISVSKLSGGDTAGKAMAGDPETPALLQPKGYEGEGKGRSGMDHGSKILLCQALMQRSPCLPCLSCCSLQFGVEVQVLHGSKVLSNCQAQHQTQRRLCLTCCNLQVKV